MAATYDTSLLQQRDDVRVHFALVRSIKQFRQQQGLEERKKALLLLFSVIYHLQYSFP